VFFQGGAVRGWLIAWLHWLLQTHLKVGVEWERRLPQARLKAGVGRGGLGWELRLVLGVQIRRVQTIVLSLLWGNQDSAIGEWAEGMNTVFGNGNNLEIATLWLEMVVECHHSRSVFDVNSMLLNPPSDVFCFLEPPLTGREVIFVRVVICTEPLATVLASVVKPCTIVQDVFQETCPAVGTGPSPRVHWGEQRQTGEALEKVFDQSCCSVVTDVELACRVAESIT